MSQKPTFDDEHKFVTSYLIQPRLLGCIRLLFGLYTLTANIFQLVWDGVHSKQEDKSQQAGAYFSYFTHLCLIGQAAWFIAAAVQTLTFASTLKFDPRPHYPLQSWPRPLQFFHELLYTSIVTYSILVTAVYWGLLTSPVTFATRFNAWSNITDHILNTVFALFEMLCTDLPVLKWIHLATTVVILGLYLALAYLTHATQGFYPYKFLDPTKTGALVGAYIVGITVGQVIVFVIVRYVIVLRERLVKRGTSESKEFTSPYVMSSL